MIEREWDRILNIKTEGIREWDKKLEYNRCEPTPYDALDRLFNSYKIQEDDKLIDFGSGKGRVAFYINHRFNIPVVGIEANDTTYDEAIRNLQIYNFKKEYKESPIKFEYGLAENHEIEVEDNLFYFFNPFSVKIFKKVVENILRSVEDSKRRVDIILYYPMPRYVKFMEKETPFKIFNKIKLPGKIDKKEKFIIYRYE